MSTNSDYYNTTAQGYEELHGDEQREKMKECMNCIKPKENEKLLDIGCGTGISTEVWNCESFGIDPAEKLIEIAKNKKGKSKYIISDAENIPFEDDYFNYVISITAIQNFSDIDKALNEISRVLKKEGKLVITSLKDSQKIEIIELKIKNIFDITNVFDTRIDRFFIGKQK